MFPAGTVAPPNCYNFLSFANNASIQIGVRFWAKTVRAAAWQQLLQRAGYTGDESEEQFDRVLEVAPSELGADLIEATPVGYGRLIGERHAPRWIRRVPKSSIGNPKP